MSPFLHALWPTLVVSLAATLPAAALAWTAGRLAGRMGLSATARAWVWRAGLAVTLLAGALAPLGLLQRAAPAAGRVHSVLLSAAPARAAPAAPGLPHIEIGALVAPLAWLMLAGMALGLARLAAGLWRAEWLRRRARPVEGLNLPVPVLASREAGAALLVGLGRPAIVLPEPLLAELSREDLTLICAHELAHLERYDHWRVLADQALAAVLWFNPPARAAIAGLAALREEFCDAAVLADAPLDRRRRYAAVLVQALRLAGAGGAQPAFIRPKGSDHVMRLQAILKPAQPTSRRALALATGLAAAAALGAGLTTVALAQQLAPVAAAARADADKARYASLDAAGYQAACASGDARDDGYCTGVIFGVLSAQDAQICEPEIHDYIAIEKQARAAIGAAAPAPAEMPRAFVTRALRAAFSCQTPRSGTRTGVQVTSEIGRTKGDVSVFEGNPTVRIIGPVGDLMILVDGRRPDTDFDVNALPSGAILRIIIAKAGSAKARALGAGPGQSVMNLELKRG